MGRIESYYDELAPHYKLLHRDWEASVARQAEFGRVVTLTDRFFQPLLVALKR